MSYPERRGRELSHAAQGAFVILAILFAAFMFTVGLYVGQNSEPEGEATPAAQTETNGEEATTTGEEATTGEGATTEGETETEDEGETETEGGETETEGEQSETGGGAGGGAEVAAGREVFMSAGCANCHTLSEANATGTVGPNLDDTDLDREEIEETVRNGRGGMPPFEGQLQDDQIEAVADFVFASAQT